MMTPAPADIDTTCAHCDKPLKPRELVWMHAPTASLFCSQRCWDLDTAPVMTPEQQKYFNLGYTAAAGEAEVGDRQRLALIAQLIQAKVELLAVCKVALGAFERNDAVDWGELAQVIAKHDPAELSQDQIDEMVAAKNGGVA